MFSLMPNWHNAGTQGFVKRYPTMPTVSRISFDFLHYVRPPAEATPVPKDSFEQLVHFLTSWSRDRKVSGNGRVDDSGLNDGDGAAANGDGGNQQLPTTDSDRLTVNLLRNLCHVFYFDCDQVCRGDEHALAPLHVEHSSSTIRLVGETPRCYIQRTVAAFQEHAPPSR